jgi:hypothetical protein
MKLAMVDLHIVIMLESSPLLKTAIRRNVEVATGPSLASPNFSLALSAVAMCDPRQFSIRLKSSQGLRSPCTWRAIRVDLDRSSSDFSSIFSFASLSITGRVFSSLLPNPAFVCPHHRLSLLATECLFKFRHVGDNTIDSLLKR